MRLRTNLRSEIYKDCIIMGCFSRKRNRDTAISILYMQMPKRTKSNSQNCSKRDSDQTPRKKLSINENNEALDFFGRGCEFSTTEPPKKSFSQYKEKQALLILPQFREDETNFPFLPCFLCQDGITNCHLLQHH